jgi:formate dehydrogenase major subunit
MPINLNGKRLEFESGERLIDVLNRSNAAIPQVCYHPQLGLDSDLRHLHGGGGRQACEGLRDAGFRWHEGSSPRRRAPAPRSGKHLTASWATIFCTARFATTTTATAPFTTRQRFFGSSTRRSLTSQSRITVDLSNPFYRYDPDQCILCGRCVEACQNLQVNETLTINWEDPHPRVQWDGGAPIGESSCVSCGHCVTVCPCNALMEKSMLGEAGYFTSLHETALSVVGGMIEVVKGIEPELGYGAILQVSEMEAAMREGHIKRTKTVCTYCGVGCSYDIWTKGRHILKVEPEHGPSQWCFDLHQRQVRLGLRQQSGPADQAADSRRRDLSRSHMGRGVESCGAQICGDQSRQRTLMHWPLSLRRSAQTRKAT